MVIGICDDIQEFREKETTVCCSVIGKYSKDFTVIQLRDGKELIDSKQQFDLLLLDIEMPQMSGIEVKNYLQSVNSSTKIIFVTSHAESMPEAFGINVFGFALKNKLEQQLSEMLESFINIVEKHTILDEGIDSDDVVYVKADGVYNMIVTNDDNYVLVRRPLKEIQEHLERYGFIRVHKSYLVNAKWISQISDKEVILGGKRVPVSARMRSEVKKKYKDYCKKNARYC
ncbi:MAG: response regulator transcription factor [Lachnospiraceae bacterium]|nr:response regulator transcription factor [Lachnospiraceae bacterium]